MLHKVSKGNLRHSNRRIICIKMFFYSIVFHSDRVWVGPDRLYSNFFHAPFSLYELRSYVPRPVNLFLVLVCLNYPHRLCAGLLTDWQHWMTCETVNLDKWHLRAEQRTVRLVVWHISRQSGASCEERSRSWFQYFRRWCALLWHHDEHVGGLHVVVEHVSLVEMLGAVSSTDIARGWLLPSHL